MVELTEEQVIGIARLAHLELAVEEIETYRGQLGAILGLVSKISSAKISELADSIVPGPSAEREDASKTSLSIDEVLANAPDSSESSFKTPKIIGAV